jgi:hypothetical protein
MPEFADARLHGRHLEPAKHAERIPEAKKKEQEERERDAYTATADLRLFRRPPACPIADPI